MESTYQHAPLLDARSVRLLKITDPKPSSLAIVLEPFHLDSLPTFEALSYTWGKAIRDEDENSDNYDLGTMHQVKCGGGLFSVMENLFDALSQLSSTSYLWIDALCIDQTNFEERSSQVLLMGEIFSAAERVIVWLGKDTSDLDDFLWVHEVFVARIDEFLESDEGIPQITRPGVLQRLDISLDRWLKYWKSYGRFYRRRRWFNRAWIVQEVTLGRKIAVRCGQASLDVGKMTLLMGVLKLTTSWWSELSELVTDLQRFHGDLVGLLIFRNTVQSGGPEAYESLKQDFAAVMGADTPEDRWYCYLHFLIQWTRAYEASDLHDKIYGILGIAQKFLPPGMENPIIPDYCQTVEELYCSISSILLEHIPILSLLSYVEDHSDRILQRLPSWSPNYSSLVKQLPLTSLTRDNSKLFDASGALGPGRLQRSISGPVMTLMGKQFDTVSGVCVPMEKIIAEFCIEPIFEICLGLDETYKPTCQDRLEALWRTMIVDIVSHSGLQVLLHPAEATFVTQFCDWVLFICAKKIASFEKQEKAQDESTYLSIVSRRNEAFRNSSVNLPSAQQVTEFAKLITAFQNDIIENKPNRVEPDLMTRASEFQRSIQFRAHGRRLFRTSQRFFGLGAKSMQEGHEIWLLQGAQIPFILRRRKDEQRYTLVGEAYVHGFMHGEMLDIPNFRSGIGPVHIV